MGKIKDKYKPRSGFKINFNFSPSSAPKKAKKPVSKIISLTQEDYYNFSRAEVWSICNFEALVFGKYTNDFGFADFRVPPNKNTKQYEFLGLIDDAVISGELKILVPKGREENPSGPLYKISIYNTDMVMADKAWWWAISVEQNGFLKLPQEFRKMIHEIMPMEFKDHVWKLPAWDVCQFVRILFGERYQAPSQWTKNKTLGKFLDRIKAEIKVKKLQPLDPLPYSDILEVSFLPIDLIEFWERYDNVLETLTWAKQLFLRIKEREGATKKAHPTNTGLVAPVGRLEINKTIAPPAPTKERAMRISLKLKAQTIFKKLQRKRNRFTYKDILEHPDWPEALEDVGYKKNYNLPKKTLSRWLTEFRKADDSTSH